MGRQPITADPVCSRRLNQSYCTSLSESDRKDQTELSTSRTLQLKLDQVRTWRTDDMRLWLFGSALLWPLRASLIYHEVKL